MSSTVNHQNPEIYFTLMKVDEKHVGFTDTLMRWSTLYKLGTSLKYNYIHQPVISKNSKDIFDFLGFNNSFELDVASFLNIKNNFLKEWFYDKRYFDYSSVSKSSLLAKFVKTSFNKVIDGLFFAGFNFIDLVISQAFLEKNKISSLADLQQAVLDFVSPRVRSQKNIVRIQLRGARKEFYGLINSELADFPDKLDLRQAYFAERQSNSCSPKFNPNKIKLLLHIRQGDTALIETPWQTYIPVYGKDAFCELKSSRDGGFADLIDVAEYQAFAEGLVQRLASFSFSTVISSDGYGKAFSLFQKNLDKFDFNPEQIKQIEALEPMYQEKFSVFDNWQDTTLLLGETDRNLYELIDATLQADIIILGFRNTLGMLLKIISHYSDRQNPPIIIELYKYRKPFDCRALLGIDEAKASYIPVCLENFCWEELVKLVGTTLVNKNVVL